MFLTGATYNKKSPDISAENMMPTLSLLSNQEVCDLMDEYGMTHGPVLASTRALYEPRLREAMLKGKKPKPSPDRTYYREEEDEVTYVYRTPASAQGRNDVLLDRATYMRTRPDWSERTCEHETSYSRPRGMVYADGPNMYDTPQSYRNVPYTKSTRVAPAAVAKAPKSRLVPIWLQILFFLIAAAFLYFVFSNMEPAEAGPFKTIE